jgi:hypothetical protein
MRTALKFQLILIVVQFLNWMTATSSADGDDGNFFGLINNCNTGMENTLVWLGA